MQPRTTALLASLALAALAMAAPQQRGYEPGVELGLLPEPVVETSGLTTGSRADGVIYTHNDSSALPFDPTNAQIFAVTHTGDLVATLQLEGVGVTDVEDIAWGPGLDGQPALYLADIGDNNRVRPQVVVYVVPEPTLDPAMRDGAVTLDDVATYTLTYPGARHDAETLLVHPTTGELTIVTKTTTGVSLLFTAPRPTAAAAAAVLTQTGTIDFGANFVRDSYNDAFPDNELQATGGEISHDGRFVAIRTYTEGHEWSLGADGNVATAVRAVPLNVVIPEESQGEALAYDEGDGALLSSTETTRVLHRMALRAVPPEDGEVPTPDPDPAPTLPATGGGLAAVGMLGALVARATRGPTLRRSRG